MYNLREALLSYISLKESVPMLSAIIALPQRVLARFVFALALLASFASAAAPASLAHAQTMSADIVDTAVAAGQFTTLATALKAAGLVDTLKGPGPFTVFAPTNAAFAQLPPGTVESLLKPENKGQLTTVLTYHVLPGHLTTADLKNAMKDGGGQATFTTVQGEPLTISERGRAFDITDSKGRTARVTIADVLQSNGVIHVINKVLMP
jgi:uncharacterized surface protein with fasciclin (FAS1) repeats